MSISHAWNLASDAELITAVRSGESSAFGVLYERHEGAARSVARQYSNSSADAEDAVADAFSRVFAVIQEGGGPDVAFRAYLFTVIRRVALRRVDSGRRATPTDDLDTFETAAELVESTEEPTMAGFERGVVSQAYRSLPERWQAVLWYTEVEELSPAEIAPVLGLTANGVAALAYRAREGLRQAYLQQHLAAPISEACTLVNGKLGAYVRGGLAKRETALVESHLEECGSCRALVLELGDVNHGMRVVIGPLVLGAAALAALKGLGFGGAAGVVGAAATAAAGTGAGGVGAGAGGAAGGGGAAGTGAGVGAGAGAGVGAGSGAAAMAGAGVSAGAMAGATAAAAGLTMVGAGAANLMGAQTASASATGAAGAAGATAGLVGAGAGAAAGGGLAALLGGIPLVAGLAAVGVVTAGALGVAGLMGAFSGPDAEDEPPAIAAPEDGGAAGSTTDADQPDGNQGTQDDAADPDTPAGDLTDPTNVPDDLPMSVSPPVTTAADPATTTPGGTTSGAPTPPPTAADPDPTAPPVDPVPVPVPAKLLVVTPGVLSFTVGREEVVEIEVTNDGEVPTGLVQTEFVFEPGTVWEVTALPPMPGGNGAARTAETPSSWVCTESNDTTAVCALPDLRGGTSSTLVAGVLIEDPDLDGARSVDVDIATWAPGLGTRPAPRWRTVAVASPPAVVTVGSPAAVTAVSSGESATIVVPVTNSGGTSVANLTATVVLPADLPTGTEITDLPDGWVCVGPIDSRLDCTLDRLVRGQSIPIELGLTAPALDRTAADPFVNRAVSTGLTIEVPSVETTVVASVTIRSAPAAYELVVGSIEATEPGTHETIITVENVGGWTATGLGLEVVLPPGLELARGNVGWESCGTGFCLANMTLEPLDGPRSVPLKLVVTGTAEPGTHEIEVALTDATGDVVQQKTLRVAVAEPPHIEPAASIGSLGACMDVDGTAARTVTVLLDNSASQVAVDFTITGAAGHTRTVPARESATVTLDVARAGGVLIVTAASWSTTLTVEPIPAWAWLQPYETGDVVVYGGVAYRYTRDPVDLDDWWSWFTQPPSAGHALWAPVEGCA